MATIECKNLIKTYGSVKALDGLDLVVPDIFGYTPAAKRQRTGLLLEMAGLEEDADRKIGGYSGGMVQRIGIAQAMYQDPEVLFLDEPVAALDPIGRKEVLDFINELKGATTVFMSTHILSDVERVCDEVAIIQAGRVVASGKATELMEKYSPGYYRLTFETPGDTEACCTILKKLNIEYTCNSSNVDASGKERNSTGESVQLKKHDFLAGRSSILGEIANLSLSLKDITQDSATLEDVFVHVIAKPGTEGISDDK